ncbi:hypothetical protein ACFLSE_03015 [Bacteroidota bacterium]
MKTAFITSLLLVYSFLSFTQDSKKDLYNEFCYNFISSIDENTTIEELEKNFNNSLQGDSLRIELEIFKKEILKYKSTSEYYIVKLNSPFNYYNINIHNPKAKEIYGDLLLKFSNSSDFIIETWKYTPFEDRVVKTDDDFNEITPITRHLKKDKN